MTAPRQLAGAPARPPAARTAAPGSAVAAAAERRTPVRSALAVALAPWLVSRALVGAILLGTALATAHLPVAGDAPGATGLFAWDGAWYRGIAEHGYAPTESWRFFPLVPLLGRAVAPLLGGSIDAGLLVVGNAAALGYAALLVALVRRELGDGPTASRVAWLACLAPGASVLALPYTEAVAGLLTVAFFLALRVDRPALAAAAGLACGLARPTGVLLAVPALVLACRGRPGGPRRRAGLLAAAAAPVAGTAAFCAYGWARTGSPLLPYTAQAKHGLRGGMVRNPFLAPFADHPLGLPWPATVAFLALAAVLLAGAFRWLPAHYAAWSAAVVFLAATSSDDHSLPRYLGAVFPLLIVAALWAGSRRRWAGVLAVATVGFVGLGALGFTDTYIP